MQRGDAACGQREPMPNQPPDPHGRFPATAAIGLAIMACGLYALALLTVVPEDWRAAGAALPFALAALYGAFLMLRSLARGLRRGPRVDGGAGATHAPRRGADPARAFDPKQFIAEQQAREMQGLAQPSGGAALPSHAGEANVRKPPRRLATPERIKKLQDLRNHPATPEAEAKAADEQLKKLRPKRRAKERKPR